MPRSPEVPSLRPASAVAFFLFASLIAVFTGCGISLTEGSSETELFKRLVVVGPLVPGAELRMGLNYEQTYNADVEVQCDLLTSAEAKPTPEPTENPLGTPTPTPVHVPAPVPTPGNRVLAILVENIGPNAEGTTADESTPVTGDITRRFTAPDEPGRYVVRCYTPADRNNQIRETIHIKEGRATP